VAVEVKEAREVKERSGRNTGMSEMRMARKRNQELRARKSGGGGSAAESSGASSSGGNASKPTPGIMLGDKTKAGAIAVPMSSLVMPVVVCGVIMWLVVTYVF
jgi:hypothetical protein